MPSSFQDISDFSSMDMTKPPGRTYKYNTSPQLWSFGWGLTYSQFSIQLVNASTTIFKQFDKATYTVRLTNIGKRDSDEVIQVYFKPLFTRVGVPTPQRQLIDFERFHVTKGSSLIATYTVGAAQLKLVDKNGVRAAHSGKYKLCFTNGADASDEIDITVA